MRTIVELPEASIKELDELKEKSKVSRAELIRRAVEEYLRSRKTESDSSAFGLWSGKGVDGLDYQEQLRSEW